jgi:hypothetical protein
MWSKQYWVPKRNWLCGGFTFFYHLIKILPLGGYDMKVTDLCLFTGRINGWSLNIANTRVHLQGVLPKVLTCHSVMTSFATGFSDNKAGKQWSSYWNYKQFNRCPPILHRRLFSK